MADVRDIPYQPCSYVNIRDSPYYTNPVLTPPSWQIKNYVVYRMHAQGIPSTRRTASSVTNLSIIIIPLCGERGETCRGAKTSKDLLSSLSVVKI